jgi:hypothetical protein
MIVSELRRAGFALELHGDNFDVIGYELTPEQVAYIAEHKAEIIAELKSEVKSNVIITCFACKHFQSFNKHGRGAGGCAVHVSNGGLCHWHDTKHQCRKYEAKP